MRLFQASLDTYLDGPPLGQPLNSRFALLQSLLAPAHFQLLSNRRFQKSDRPALG